MRLTVKQIRAELRKLKTFDEKKSYLEQILEVVKGRNLRAELKKILAELKEHIEAEEKLARGDALEQKLAKGVASGKEIEAEESQAAARIPSVTDAIKYARRPTREESQLEQTARTAPAGGAGAAAERRYTAGRIAYQSSSQAMGGLQTRLQEAGLARKFDPNSFNYMSSQDRDKIFEFAKEYFGMPDSMSESQYSQLSYTIQKVFGIDKDKEKEKYKIRH